MHEKVKYYAEIIVGPFVGMLVMLEIYLVIFSIVYYNFLHDNIIIKSTIAQVIWNLLFLAVILLGINMGKKVVEKKGFIYEAFKLRKESLITVLVIGVIFLANAISTKTPSVFMFGKMVSASNLGIFMLLLSFLTTVLFFYPFSSLLAFLINHISDSKIKKSKSSLMLLLLLVVVNPFFVEYGYEANIDYQMGLTYTECGVIVSSIKDASFIDAGFKEGDEVLEINNVKIKTISNFLVGMTEQKTNVTIKTKTSEFTIEPTLWENLSTKMDMIELTQKMCKK